MFLQFFLPYLTLCHLASWGIAQNLEGLELFHYLNTAPIQFGDSVLYPMNLNPAIGVANLSVALTGILVLVFLLNIRASFYLNKWIGGTSLILWLLPGLISVLGYMPDIRGMGPDVFRFGTGFPGSTAPTVANLLICLIGGWSSILLLGSHWKKSTFKNAYDHIWYTLGLIAVLYFVADTGLPSYKEDLANNSKRMTHTLQLFRSAGEHLEVLCPLPEAARLSPALCALAPELKGRVFSYLDMEDNLRARIAPPGWAATLAHDPVLARQIEALNNWACVQGRQPAQCQTVPTDTALSIKDIDTPLAFPPPRYAELIHRLHASMEASDKRIHDIRQGHNLRYFIFLVIAILAGGKLANASRAMVGDDSVRPPSWILMSIKYATRRIMILLKFLAMLSNHAYRHITRRAAALLARCRDAKAARPDEGKKPAFEQE